MPFDLTEEVKPIYKTFKGWQRDMTGARSEGDLSEDFMVYVRFIEEYLGIPIHIISVGPGS